jgi:hypothetical protein
MKTVSVTVYMISIKFVSLFGGININKSPLVLRSTETLISLWQIEYLHRNPAIS